MGFVSSLQEHKPEPVKSESLLDISKLSGGLPVALTGSFTDWESEEFDCTRHGSVGFVLEADFLTATEIEITALRSNRVDTAAGKPIFERITVLGAPDANGKSINQVHVVGHTLANFPADADSKSRMTFTLLTMDYHRVKIQVRVASGSLVNPPKPQLFALGGKGI